MFPEYTPTERRIDGAIHLLGVGLSLAAIGALVHAMSDIDALHVLAGAIYGFGLVASLGASAAYHLIGGPRWKEMVRRCDRAAIYLMIAGTYTPFALIAIGGRVGLALFAIVLSGAVAGIAVVWLRPRRYERVATILYLTLGWAGLPLLGLLIERLAVPTFVLLGAGGVLYTTGVVFHLWRGLRYQNAVWHGFVLAAAACHFFAVLQVVAGQGVHA